MINNVFSKWYVLTDSGSSKSIQEEHRKTFLLHLHQLTPTNQLQQGLSLALKPSNVAEVRSVWLCPLHPTKQKSCIQAAPSE